jgi:hypothetical protein
MVSDFLYYFGMTAAFVLLFHAIILPVLFPTFYPALFIYLASLV